MTRADRVERLLRKMDEDHQKNLAKLRGSGAPRIRAVSEEEFKSQRTIFLVALACVSDEDLGTLEREVGIGVPPKRATKRATKRVRPTCPQCHRDLHEGVCEF